MFRCRVEHSKEKFHIYAHPSNNLYLLIIIRFFKNVTALVPGLRSSLLFFFSLSVITLVLTLHAEPSNFSEPIGVHGLLLLLCSCFRGCGLSNFIRAELGRADRWTKFNKKFNYNFKFSTCSAQYWKENGSI